MGGYAYGTIGFASAIGCSMTVSQATSEAIKYTASVTAALATASVYTPGHGNPTSVTGAQSWSKVGDAVTAILPTGTHQVTLSYTQKTTDTSDIFDPLKKLITDTSGVLNFIENNIIIITTVIIGWFIFTVPKSTKKKWSRKARKALR
jgi:hypothetical protein